MLQAVALLALFAVQGSVLAGVRADRAAELGAGPVVPVSAPQGRASPPVRVGIPALGRSPRALPALPSWSVTSTAVAVRGSRQDQGDGGR